MNYRAFQRELQALLKKHDGDGLIACFAFGIAYIEKDGSIRGDAATMVRTPPVDHEEEILRNGAAAQVSAIVRRLVQNTYLTTEEEGHEREAE